MVVCTDGSPSWNSSLFKCYGRYPRHGKFNRKGASTRNNIGILYEYCCCEFSRIYIIKAGNDMEVTCYYFYTFTNVIHNNRMANQYNLHAIRGYM